MSERHESRLKRSENHGSCLKMRRNAVKIDEDTLLRDKKLKTIRLRKMRNFYYLIRLCVNNSIYTQCQLIEKKLFLSLRLRDTN